MAVTAVRGIRGLIVHLYMYVPLRYTYKGNGLVPLTAVTAIRLI
jgi:hypothetical protein